MNRWLALIVLCTGFLMIILDQTVVNVALPSIQANLRFSEASLAWVVNGYLITFGGLLLLSGRIGDLVGRKRVFLAGLVLFTGASLCCGLSTSRAMLITARFVQGVGAAVTSAVILGVIVTLFTDPPEVRRAIGIYSFVGAGGGSIGLLVGGALTQAINWHWIFFINVPIGVLVAVAGLRALPNDEGIGLAKGADLLGALLITAGVMLGVYAILETSAYGWASVRTAGLGAVAITLLALFAVRQATAGHPLVPLRVFRSRNLAGGNIILILLLAGSFGQFFFGSLYLRQVLGYHPLQIGLAFLPVAVLIGTLSMFASPRLQTRFGARNVLVPALLIIAAGLVLLFARTSVGGHYASNVLPGLLLLGIGGGLGFPALVTVAMSGAAPEDAGLASGIVGTTQQVGGALGLAVLASLAAARTSHLVAEGIPAKVALTSGYHLAFAVAAVLVAAGAVLALTVLRTVAAPVQATADDQPAAVVDRSSEMAE
jgi:EmrB/QacA subfamily drug resistance transporter